MVEVRSGAVERDGSEVWRLLQLGLDLWSEWGGGAVGEGAGVFGSLLVLARFRVVFRFLPRFFDFSWPLTSWTARSRSLA